MERDEYNGGDKKDELGVCCAVVIISLEGHKKSKCLLYQQTSDIIMYSYFNASQKKRITKEMAREYCMGKPKNRIFTTMDKFIAGFPPGQLKVLYWI